MVILELIKIVPISVSIIIKTIIGQDKNCHSFVRELLRLCGHIFSVASVERVQIIGVCLVRELVTVYASLQDDLSSNHTLFDEYELQVLLNIL